MFTCSNNYMKKVRSFQLIILSSKVNGEMLTNVTEIRHGSAVQCLVQEAELMWERGGDKWGRFTDT